MNYWMVKQEPEAYSWTTLLEEGRTAWTGVRNFQARNHLRAMKTGDLVLFYHSVSQKRVVGLARVVRAAYPEPGGDGDWSAVDIAPVKTLTRPVALDEIKRQKPLANLPLLRQSRLSVLPLSPPEFRCLLELAQTRL